MNLKLGIDLMWGTWWPDVMIPAVEELLWLHPEVRFQVYGNAENIWNCLIENSKVDFIGTEADITDDLRFPTKSKLLRCLVQSRKSSIIQMVDAISEWDLDAIIGRWNTWAYMWYAMNKMKIDWEDVFPALSCWLPRVDIENPWREQKDVLFMDVWATFDTTVEKLMNNAYLWIEMLTKSWDISKPCLALLNAGGEEYKWDKAYVEWYKALKNEYWDRFLWNIEPNALVSDLRPDLIVTWWMVWNTALKSMEWMFAVTSGIIKETVFWNPIKRVLWAYTWRQLKKWLGRFDPNLRWDGILHGIEVPNNWMVVKAHGDATVKWVVNACTRTIENLKARRAFT